MTSVVKTTRYFLPHGHKERYLITTTPHLAEVARKLFSMGYTIECETLSTGEFSITVTDPQEGDILMEIAEGSTVEEECEALEQLLRDAEELLL